MMPPIQVDYDGRVSWGSRQNNFDHRPYAKIRIHNGPASIGFDILGLLDTGADYLMLDAKFAILLGVNLSKAPTERVLVASGRTILLPKQTVEITINQKRIAVEALFGIRGLTLIGRLAILKAMDFGIDIDGWLYRMA